MIFSDTSGVHGAKAMFGKRFKLTFIVFILPVLKQTIHT